MRSSCITNASQIPLILGMQDSASCKLFASTPAIPTNKTFIKEIPMSRRTAFCTLLLLLVCWASLVVPASAQHFQQVDGPRLAIAAGRSEVFGVDDSNAAWRYHASSNSFKKIAGALLDRIAVGGGTDSQLDEVWGIGVSNQVLRFNYSTNTFDQIPGNLSQITVGVGYEDQCHPYEVWGINNGQQVFRYDYCSGRFNQSPGSLLFVITTGGSDVWGIYTNNQVYHYSFAQHKFVEVPGSLDEIAVGVNDVWGRNNAGEIFRYDPNTGSWSLKGSGNEVAAGGDGVWAIGENNSVWRFDSSAEAFVEVPGNLDSITVGSGAGVFGENVSGQLFRFVRP
jgi:hypothetical protein